MATFCAVLIITVIILGFLAVLCDFKDEIITLIGLGIIVGIPMSLYLLFQNIGKFSGFEQSFIAVMILGVVSAILDNIQKNKSPNESKNMNIFGIAEIGSIVILFVMVIIRACTRS